MSLVTVSTMHLSPANRIICPLVWYKVNRAHKPGTARSLHTPHSPHWCPVIYRGDTEACWQVFVVWPGRISRPSHGKLDYSIDMKSTSLSLLSMLGNLKSMGLSPVQGSIPRHMLGACFMLHTLLAVLLVSIVLHLCGLNDVSSWLYIMQWE